MKKNRGRVTRGVMGGGVEQIVGRQKERAAFLGQFFNHQHQGRTIEPTHLPYLGRQRQATIGVEQKEAQYKQPRHKDITTKNQR